MALMFASKRLKGNLEVINATFWNHPDSFDFVYKDMYYELEKK